MVSIKRKQIVAMNQHYQRFSLDYFLDCQQRLGIHNIELWCGASHFWLDSYGYEDCKALKKKLRDRNLKVVSLTSPSCAYQYQYASQEKFHLEQSFKYFRNGIEAASEFEAEIVVVNSGWGYTNENYDDMWKRSKENLQRLCDIASKRGIKLAMESLRDDESNLVNSLETAKRMYDEVNHSDFKVMVDNIATGASGETLSQWFDTFGKALIHMHFLDGNPYVHNIWGDGNTSLERQLQELNNYEYEGYLVQEVADEGYFNNPFEADIRNMRVLERFIED